MRASSPTRSPARASISARWPMRARSRWRSDISTQFQPTGTPARDRRPQDKDLRLHQRLRPPPCRPHRHPRCREEGRPSSTRSALGGVGRRSRHRSARFIGHGFVADRCTRCDRDAWSKPTSPSAETADETVPRRLSPARRRRRSRRRSMAPLDALLHSPSRTSSGAPGIMAPRNARYRRDGCRGRARAVGRTDVLAGRHSDRVDLRRRSSVLLHMVAQVDPTLPVYLPRHGQALPRDARLSRRSSSTDLGLTNVRARRARPRAACRVSIRTRALWMTDPDLCCQIRKTEPLDAEIARLGRLVHRPQALPDQRARWRSRISRLTSDDRIKVNPLAYLRRTSSCPMPITSSTGSPSTRCSRRATNRSAACPAPQESPRARTSRRPLARPEQEGMRHPFRPRGRRQRNLRPLFVAFALVPSPAITYSTLSSPRRANISPSFRTVRASFTRSPLAWG